MNSFDDLRAYLNFLEKKGRLFRIQREVVKETELMPLVRLQFRGLPEEERGAFLFERITDVKGRKYDGQVAAAVYGASRQMFAWGMECDNPGEIYERWRQALSDPIPPRLVSSGPVQEEVHAGAELERLGMDEFPVPVEEPGFSGTLRTTNQFITRDPQTGIRNVGTYSGHLRGRNRLMCAIGPVHHARLYHWRSARERKIPLPAAIVIGAIPVISYVGSAAIAYGIDELAVAGGLIRRPIELVRCKTVDLEVPATAEIVIEGEISTEVLEPYSAFGEYPGYMMMESRSNAIMKITCITHRKNPIFTPILVGLPPSDNHILQRYTTECMYYGYLKYECNLPMVQDLAFHDSGSGWNYCVVRIRKSHPSQPWQVLYAVAGRDPGHGKIVIVVDEDINPCDPEMVNWALSYAMQPARDVKIITGRVPRLDPSSLPFGVKGEERSFPPPTGSSAMLIDATRKWPYPPVALPRKEFMERAITLWREEGLPELHLRPPWHGYTLGLWSDEEEENAQLILQGNYLKLGEKMKNRQTRAGEG
jgi:4-hydroxy-3-polyprenylbenzoate decarboxylase